MTTHPSMGAGALDPATIAALLATATKANHPDAWRDVALKLAEAWPAPKKTRGKRKGGGEYTRVLVTFADGASEISGTYQRTPAGEVDLAAAERGAIFFRKAVAWQKAREAIGYGIYGIPTSDAPGHTWVRSAGRWRPVPPPVDVPAVSRPLRLARSLRSTRAWRLMKAFHDAVIARPGPSSAEE